MQVKHQQNAAFGGSDLECLTCRAVSFAFVLIVLGMKGRVF